MTSLKQPVCIGWRYASGLCNARSMRDSEFCYHHKWQGNHLSHERESLAEARYLMRKETKALRARARYEQTRDIRMAKKLEKKCHSCRVYTVTVWNEEKGYWHCKRHP